MIDWNLLLYGFARPHGITINKTKDFLASRFTKSTNSPIAIADCLTDAHLLQALSSDCFILLSSLTI